MCLVGCLLVDLVLFADFCFCFDFLWNLGLFCVCGLVLSLGFDYCIAEFWVSCLVGVC